MNKKIYFFLSCLFVVPLSGRCDAIEDISTSILKSFGETDQYYTVSFTYNIDGIQYLYEQRKDKKWSIRELLSNGKMNVFEIARGSLDFFYDIQFPYSIGGKQYFFGHTTSNDSAWFIRELLPDGRMSEKTHSGNWPEFNRNIFAVSIEKKLYLRASNNHSWNMWRLLRGGYIGPKVGEGISYGFEVDFPFSIDSVHYIYYQRVSNSYWFIQELLVGGRMGRVTDEHVWNNLYQVQFPFSIGSKQYFYAHTASGPWIIRELLSGGKMGELIDYGNWGGSFLIQFPFAFNGTQYLYAQSTVNGTSFVRLIRYDAKMGEEMDRNIWSYWFYSSIDMLFRNTQTKSQSVSKLISMDSIRFSLICCNFIIYFQCFVNLDRIYYNKHNNDNAQKHFFVYQHFKLVGLCFSESITTSAWGIYQHHWNILKLNDHSVRQKMCLAIEFSHDHVLKNQKSSSCSDTRFYLVWIPNFSLTFLMIKKKIFTFKTQFYFVWNSKFCQKSWWVKLSIARKPLQYKIVLKFISWNWLQMKIERISFS